MFGNKPKETYTSAPVSSSSSKQEITTLLSEGCRFEGNMFAPSNTRIDGDVKGNINGQSVLVIGEKGKIEGDVIAVDVLIYGQVTGTVKSHKLELRKGCRLTGDAYVEVLTVEPGVIFNGKSVMEPKKQTPLPSDSRSKDTVTKTAEVSPVKV
ncbi:MAG: bactofilin family protein [Ignavibacteria bacterium]